MNGNEMTVAGRILFLERAVEELRLELSKVEMGLVGDTSLGASEDQVVPVPNNQHQELANILQEQQAALSKILTDALAEMEKLRRGSSG